MSDLDEMSLVLHHHRWETLQDWVSKLNQLADLSDEQIDNLVVLSAPWTRPVARWRNESSAEPTECALRGVLVRS